MCVCWVVCRVSDVETGWCVYGGRLRRSDERHFVRVLNVVPLAFLVERIGCFTLGDRDSVDRDSVDRDIVRKVARWEGQAWIRRDQMEDNTGDC